MTHEAIFHRRRSGACAPHAGATPISNLAIVKYMIAPGTVRNLAFFHIFRDHLARLDRRPTPKCRLLDFTSERKRQTGRLLKERRSSANDDATHDSESLLFRRRRPGREQCRRTQGAYGADHYKTRRCSNLISTPLTCLWRARVIATSYVPSGDYLGAWQLDKRCL
jgi:hypothetical protein